MLGYPAGQQLKPDELRRVLTALVERIDWTLRRGTSRSATERPVTGVKMAFPPGFKPRYLIDF
jgi:hypothetical protein